MHESLANGFAVARTLWLDRQAAIAAAQLQEAGVPSILLKGAAVATWLYQDGAARPYGDIDLLVSPGDFDRAKATLAELGYVHRLAGAAACEFGPNEQELVRPDGICIDLHHRLLGVPSSTRCWEVLSGRTVPLALGSGAEVEVLDEPARAMHLALHAAQNGPAGTKSIADLTRGLQQLPSSHWQEAARLAAELDATAAFASGLRLVPAGAALAEELGLPRSLTVELAVRARSASEKAFVFQQLAEARGLRAKAALMARKLFPTAVFMRATYPAASRGRLGLLAARLEHLLTLPAKAARGLSTWRRARREVARLQDRG